MLPRFCTLGLSLLLCLPALAETPKPAPAPPAAAPSAYHWQRIMLHHAQPEAVLTALHWNTTTPIFPHGVQRVFALQSGPSLLLHATDAGFAEAMRLVQTVDQAPTVPQVRLQADFVGASRTDVDNLGVRFDPAPTAPVTGQPTPQTAQLRTATGNIVSQLYQTLTRMHGTEIHTPAAITTSDVPAKLMVNSHITYYPYRVTTSSIGDPRLRETRELPLQASITLTPRVNSDGSLALHIVTEAGSSITRTIPNGQMLVLEGLPLSKEKPTDDQELLVFVTPTVIGSVSANTEAKPPVAPVVDTGQPDPPMPGITDTPAEATKHVTVDVTNADLATAVAMLRRQMQANITLHFGDTPYRPVFVHLEHATPAEVLRAVARSAGAMLTRDRQGGYVFAMPASPTAPEAALSTEPAPFRPVTPDTYRLHSVALKHVRASDLIAKMHWNPEPASPYSPLETVPPPRRYPLPVGVRQVFAVDESNTLFADATDSGFSAIMQTVNALDIGPQPIEFNTLLLAVPTSRRGLDPATQDAAGFLTTLLSGARRLVWAVPVTAEGGQDLAVAIGGQSIQPGFQLSTQKNLDGTLTLHPSFDGISPLPARTTSPGKAAVWEVPHQPLVTGERLFFFVCPVTLRAEQAASSGQVVTITP